jgi:hypothetical protein
MACDNFQGSTPAPAVVNRRRFASFDPELPPELPMQPTNANGNVYEYPSSPP